MDKVRSRNFYMSESDGDEEILDFIESCHPEFENQRINGADTEFQLLVEVKVTLLKDAWKEPVQE